MPNVLSAAGKLSLSDGDAWETEDLLQPEATWSAQKRRQVRVRLTPDGSIGVQLESPVLPQWLLPTLEAFMKVLHLPTNWDTYGAAPISPRVVVSALTMLAESMAEESVSPHVVPTSRGGLQLEWHLRRDDLEVEVMPSGHYEYSLEREGRETEDEGSISDVTELARLIRELE